MENTNRAFLNFWFISTDDGVSIAHGLVKGHRKQPDGIHVHTSVIHGIEIDREQETAIITTKNTIYQCSLRHCRFKVQDKYPDALPDYKELKEKYGKRN